MNYKPGGNYEIPDDVRRGFSARVVDIKENSPVEINKELLNALAPLASLMVVVQSDNSDDDVIIREVNTLTGVFLARITVGDVRRAAAAIAKAEGGAK